MLVDRIPYGGTVGSYADPRPVYLFMIVSNFSSRPVYLFMILSNFSYQQDIDTDEKLRTFQPIRQNTGLHGTQKGKQGKLLKYLNLHLSSHIYMGT